MAYNELKKYLPDALLHHVLNQYLLPSEEEVKNNYKNLMKNYKSVVLGYPCYFVSPDVTDDQLSKFTRIGLIVKIMKNSLIKVNHVMDSDSDSDSLTSSDSEEMQELEEFADHVLRCQRPRKQFS